MDKEPIKAIADILCNQMNLTPERIFILNDSRTIPNDDKLYVTIDLIMNAPFSADVKYTEDLQGYQEVQSLAIKQTIVVSLISRNSDARTRAYEVQMAMNSTYSQQSQEKYGYHIASISPIHNRSFLEESARLNRFDTELSIITAVQKKQVVDYYDDAPYTIKFEG